MQASFENETLIRIKKVEEITGLKRSQVYALASRGSFPKPIKLSERCAAWLESETRAWVAQRIAAARNLEV